MVVVVLVVVVLVVVVVDSPLVVNASSGTIDHPSLLIFHASIRHVEPPFSYINRFRLAAPALMSICPDSIQEQPWSFQLPHSLPPMLMMPPSSEANQNSIV